MTTTAEQHEELAYHEFKCMDMEDVEEFIVETLIQRYRDYPIPFVDHWNEYKKANKVTN